MLAGASIRLNANELKEAEETYNLLMGCYSMFYKGIKNPEIFSELEVYRRQIEYLRKAVTVFKD